MVTAGQGATPLDDDNGGGDGGPVASRRSLDAYIRHELFQLTVLIGIAAALYAMTVGVGRLRERFAAADERAWFGRGQEAMARQDPAAAIVFFRRADTGERRRLDHGIALAGALAANHQLDDARQLLMARRVDAPENIAVNRELASIAVRRGDVTEAIRFFNDVLYAPPVGNEDPAHPQLRLELAAFLVDHGEASRAVSELMVASERSLTASERLTAGRLFERVGEREKALGQYDEVRQMAPSNVDAMLGAARVLLALGRYRDAQPLLHAIGNPTPDVQDDADTVDAVMALDPLAAGLSRVERAARVRRVASHLRGRLAACASGADPARHDALVATAGALLTSGGSGRDGGGILAASRALDEIHHWLEGHCPSSRPADRALALIAGVHERRS